MIKNYKVCMSIIDYKKFVINESNKSNLVYNKKYYDVIFITDYTFENLYMGENNYLPLNVKKGDKLRIFIDNNKTTNTQLYIKGIKPIDIKENKVAENNIKVLYTYNLWDANFIIDNTSIKVTDLPFKIEF